MAILVTGGAGYIGSHTCVELLNNNFEVIVVDDFSNSKPDVFDKIEYITGKKVLFYNINLLDKSSFEKVFIENRIESVIHFAGFKAVGESVQNPIEYYNNNIIGTLNLCKLMEKYNVRKLVFSSSASVYGNTNEMPVKENGILNAQSPYARTKQMIEEILNDIYISNPKWNIILLRYFNPIGAHESGLIGENTNHLPSNLMPYITKVASGQLEILQIFGNDYDTVDGTGVRDYIHVVDLAKGHIKALESFKINSGINTYNLGTGIGYSVLEVITTFEESTGKNIPYAFTKKRVGDVAISYADTSKASKEIGWETTKNLIDMCKDSWRWEVNNLKECKD